MNGGDETSELIRKMNALLRGEGDQAPAYRAVEPQISRLWQLFDEERAHSSPARIRALRETAIQEPFLSRLDAPISTAQVGHGVSVTRTAAGSAADLALALAISDHIKRNKSS